jgi:hypothetical protein
MYDLQVPSPIGWFEGEQGGGANLRNARYARFGLGKQRPY